MDHSSHNGGRPGFFASRANLVLIGFLIVGGFYLVMEHRAHLLGWLPWLLLLACPLMHVFMHGGHGGHGGKDAGSGTPDGSKNQPHQH